MKKIRCNLEYDWKQQKVETITKPTRTVPDEATSIREILMRYSQGYEYVRKNSIYDNPEDFDEVDPTRLPDFDLSDAHTQLTEIADRVRTAERKPKPKADEPKPAGEVSPEEV